jgi:hypothetical protein
MTETTMPYGGGLGICEEGFRSRRVYRGEEGVQLYRAIAPDDHIPGLEVLHGKAKWIKFNRNKIISCKAMNRYKIFDDIMRNQNVIKIKGMRGRWEVRMTGGSNRQQGPITDDDASRGRIIRRKDTRKNTGV